MKAFEIECSILNVIGFYAAPTAGKAKWCAALSMLDTGYARNAKQAFTALRCRRRPDLDEWASQFSDVVCCSEIVVEQRSLL